MMTSPFELDFHDSEISRVERVGDSLLLRFSAAKLRRLGAMAGDIGYAKTLEASFSAAEWSGREKDCIGRIAEGWLVIGERRFSTITLPFEHTGPLKAEFAFNNRALLSLTAAAVTFGFSGDPAFAESYAC